MYIVLWLIMQHYIKCRVAVKSPWECTHSHVLQKHGIVLQVFHCAHLSRTVAALQQHAFGPATLQSFGFVFAWTPRSHSPAITFETSLFTCYYVKCRRADAHQLWRPQFLHKRKTDHKRPPNIIDNTSASLYRILLSFYCSIITVTFTFIRIYTIYMCT
jgi:hypothetical protein